MINTRYLTPQAASIKWRMYDWFYVQKGNRDLRLDFLRGYAVFAMIVDHLGSDSWLQNFTGGNRFFVSAAEGFVFISGLLVGIIYGDMMRKIGWWPAARKALARAWTLYTLTVPLTLLFVWLIGTFNLPFASWYVIGDPLKLIFDVATMQRTFAFADIPLLYTQLLLLAPVALWLMNRGKTGWMLTGSLALWGAYQVSPTAMSGFPWNIEGNWVFHVAAWQLLFFAAMALGYHRKTVSRRLGRFMRLRWFSLALAATVALLVIFPNANPDDPTIMALFDKASLSVGRLAASAVVFSTLYMGTTLFWKPLYGTIGWLFNPLGENSLYSYTMHVMLLVGYYIVVAHIGSGDGQDIVANSVLQLGAVALTWQMIRKNFLFRVIPR
ncbi:MAG: OpgC domain-containing protein [Chloroflexi bacterium]|nr:OpgC domain-containing protein [Chloroflexota bacterium]